MLRDASMQIHTQRLFPVLQCPGLVPLSESAVGTEPSDSRTGTGPALVVGLGGFGLHGFQGPTGQTGRTRAQSSHGFFWGKDIKH